MKPIKLETLCCLLRKTINVITVLVFMKATGDMLPNRAQTICHHQTTDTLKCLFYLTDKIKPSNLMHTLVNRYSTRADTRLKQYLRSH